MKSVEVKCNVCQNKITVTQSNFQKVWDDTYLVNCKICEGTDFYRIEEVLDPNHKETTKDYLDKVRGSL
jgi:predicted nucleic-acid-binding Zn-ribbon protein